MQKKITPEQQRKYLRIPFKSGCRGFDGCDCGGLVWLIYKNELNIELPNWTELYSGTRIENSLELAETVSTVLGENATEVEFEDRQATYRDWETDRKSTRLNSSHSAKSRMPSSA